MLCVLLIDFQLVLKQCCNIFVARFTNAVAFALNVNVKIIYKHSSVKIKISGRPVSLVGGGEQEGKPPAPCILHIRLPPLVVLGLFLKPFFHCDHYAFLRNPPPLPISPASRPLRISFLRSMAHSPPPTPSAPTISIRKTSILDHCFKRVKQRT